jgi:uncharacterized damage-inducible protein DinB
MPSLQQTDLRYPIGGPAWAESYTAAERQAAIEEIRRLPQVLGSAVAGWSDERLDTPYRPGGWTVRQLVHHVADSHVNAYIRVRFALTEDWPTVVPYEEAVWAELADARTAPVAGSLELLQGLHTRWTQLWASLDEPQWKRGYVHPVDGRETLEQVLVLYAWHGRHHTAHVTGLAARMGW